MSKDQLMPPNEHVCRRRQFLKTSVITAVGVSGCLSDNSGSPADSATHSPETQPITSQTSDGSEPVNIVSLSVTDYIVYALAGVHPHVHRRKDKQYLTLSVNSALSRDTIQNQLRVNIDGESVPLAESQPVRWRNETIDIAFAVSKTETFDSGYILYDQKKRQSLSKTILTRLNTPPVFEVSELSVSPRELRAGTQREVTVSFTLTNTGDGRGTFGASLSGNFTSGSQTVTATLDSDSERNVTQNTRVIGRNDTVTIRLDWGVDEWMADISIIGTPIGSQTSTPAPK